MGNRADTLNLKYRRRGHLGIFRSKKYELETARRQLISPWAAEIILSRSSGKAYIFEKSYLIRRGFMGP